MSFNEYYQTEAKLQDLKLEQGKIYVKKVNKQLISFIEYENHTAHYLSKKNANWHHRGYYISGHDSFFDFNDCLFDIEAARDLWVELAEDGWQHINSQR
jgi:hypothetical protein